MKTKKKYLLEITTEDLPISELNFISKSLKCAFLKNFTENNITIYFFKSFFTFKRFIFFFNIKYDINFNFIFLIENIFYTTKFKTFMRWGENKQTFIRPLTSYLFMCNNKIIKHILFNLQSDKYTLISNLLFKKKIKVNFFNYFKVLYSNNIIYSYTKRLKLLLFKIKKFFYKNKLNVSYNLNNIKDISNSFESPQFLFIIFNNSLFKMPIRLLILVILSYGYIPFLKKKKIIYFLVVLNSFKKKKIKEKLNCAIENKIFDIASMYYNESIIITDFKFSKFKNIILNEKFDTLYNRFFRLLKLTKCFQDILFFNLKIIKKTIFLINLELLTKFIYEYPNLTGLLFIDFYSSDKIKNNLYEYNKIFNNEIPKTVYGAFIVIINNIEEIVQLVLNNYNFYAKNDPYNIKNKVLNVIKSIIKSKIKFDFYDLLYKTFFIFKSIDINKINKLFIFFIDKLKFTFNFKYIAFTKKKKCLFCIYLISKSLNSIFKYKFNNDFFLILKRIKKITDKNKISFLIKLKKNLIFEFDEKILFLSLKKNLFISKILLKKNLYFENIKYLLKIKNKIDKFFCNIYVLSENVNIRNNRLKLLFIIKKLFEKFLNLDTIGNLNDKKH